MAGVTSYLIGYKFVPTDEELICYYLKLGIVTPFFGCIVQQDIYSHEPQSLNFMYNIIIIIIYVHVFYF